MKTFRATLPLALSLAALSLAPAAGTAQTDPVERRIVQEVDARADEGISLLERVVNVNSGTMNLAGVREVGRILRAQFDALGFETRWIDGTPFQRAGHLVARHPGTGTRVLLIGHLDTVFEPDSPFQRFVRDGDRAAGPGVVDMK
ncbi:MAG TPA: hypothetical protein VLA43_17160, partial [Longimicrobiales bacterium]|nr:hypothetical protein [Longimicrobiales bacterium]